MAERNRCPKCGQELSGDATDAICPRCSRGAPLTSTVGYDVVDVLSDAVGEQFGAYRILRRLGAGGMGAVYEAEDAESGRRVALKILNHKLQSPEHRRRFLREGRLAAAVNHSHVVYVFGTEEIAGTPVIAMELAAGGTLQDRVQRTGPLPVGEAVDVMLSVIEGLEAAHIAGVLHRDVKPSNCFVDVDGVVKVGDFGLSVSTELRDDTNLTQSGVFLGTPAFASPEQLRGDELDVRSDIYSVGVTLYFLLTGKLPFEAKQMVQLLATVLERPAPSPRAHRAEIPEGLATVVLRCLAKQSSQRYRDYGELRRALLPYQSMAPTPATLGLRVLAQAIDYAVAMTLASLLPLLWVRDMTTWWLHFEAISAIGPRRSAELNWLSIIGGILALLYFALLEGLWGASAGKAICRLRVVGPRREAPGVLRALLRTSVFLAAGALPWWIVYAIDPEWGVQLFAGSLRSKTDFAVALACGTSYVLPFLSMRRRNGYAGLHELVSATRVVHLPATGVRPALAKVDNRLPESADPARIGPYDVLGPLSTPPANDIILAYDTRLLRKVWVVRRAADAPPVSLPLRELSRIGRLRWLNGQRGVEGCWDAYDAPTGAPLLTLIAQPQPWDAVRFWLLDLALELTAGRTDQTTPAVLDLDRIWITADGRAKLLDFRAPGLADTADAPPSVANDASAQEGAILLKRTASGALEGRIVVPRSDVIRPIDCRLPLTAHRLLNDLGRSSSTDLPLAELELLTRKPATVSVQRRWGALVACWLPPIMMASLLLPVVATEREFLRKYPEVGELAGFLAYYQSLPQETADAETEQLRAAVEIVITDRFRQTIERHDVWDNSIAEGFLNAHDQRLLKQLIDRHADLSPSVRADAAERVQPAHDEIAMLGWSSSDFLYASPLPVIFTATITLVVLLFVLIPSLASALLLGETLLMRFLEIAIVNRHGAPASRLRVAWRNLLLWTNVLVYLGALVAMGIWGGPPFAAAIIVGWMVTTFVYPRGPHDLLAGTWLVPR